MEARFLSRAEIGGAVSVALWGALIAVGAYVAAPLGPVPFTLQTFFLFLCAFREGSKRASQATSLYLAAGLAGLPIFTGGLAGPSLLLGPTAGFALSFPVAAWVAGGGARGGKVSPLKFIVRGLLGEALIVGMGALGLTLNLGLDWRAALGVALVFVPGDALKICVAALLAVGYLRKRAVARAPKPKEA
ncbi:MAG: biotin transporter BioY [Deltaproteobacteria bacterium]|nr:biotin transporter BioY [Deltaproteobacteria bacterium]